MIVIGKEGEDAVGKNCEFCDKLFTPVSQLKIQMIDTQRKGLLYVGYVTSHAIMLHFSSSISIKLICRYCMEILVQSQNTHKTGEIGPYLAPPSRYLGEIC